MDAEANAKANAEACTLLCTEDYGTAIRVRIVRSGRRAGAGREQWYHATVESGSGTGAERPERPCLQTVGRYEGATV